MQPRPHSGNQKIIFLTILILVLLSAGLAGGYSFIQKNQKIEKIDSFESCAALKGIVLETYPERCIAPDGKNFYKKY